MIERTKQKTHVLYSAQLDNGREREYQSVVMNHGCYLSTII